MMESVVPFRGEWLKESEEEKVSIWDSKKGMFNKLTFEAAGC